MVIRTRGSVTLVFFRDPLRTAPASNVSRECSCMLVRYIPTPLYKESRTPGARWWCAERDPEKWDFILDHQDGGERPVRATLHVGTVVPHAPVARESSEAG